MVTFKLIGFENGEYIYEYYPEGDESDPGRFAMSPSGQRRLIETAKNRKFSNYYHHAANKVAENIGVESGISAWY